MIFENPYFFQMVTSRTSRALSLESSTIPIRVVRARRSRSKMSTVNWLLLYRIERGMLYDFPPPEKAAKKTTSSCQLIKNLFFFWVVLTTVTSRKRIWRKTTTSCQIGQDLFFFYVVSHGCFKAKKNPRKHYNFMSNWWFFLLSWCRFSDNFVSNW